MVSKTRGGDYSLSTSSVLRLKLHATTPSFLHGCWGSNSVPVLVWLALYRASCLPAPVLDKVPSVKYIFKFSLLEDGNLNRIQAALNINHSPVCFVYINGSFMSHEFPKNVKLPPLLFLPSTFLEYRHFKYRMYFSSMQSIFPNDHLYKLW